MDVIRKDLDARTFVGWLGNCAWARSVVVRSEKVKNLWCWSNTRYDWVCRFCGEFMPDDEMNKDDFRRALLIIGRKNTKSETCSALKPTECPSCGAKVGEWRI